MYRVFLLRCLIVLMSVSFLNACNDSKKSLTVSEPAKPTETIVDPEDPNSQGEVNPLLAILGVVSVVGIGIGLLSLFSSEPEAVEDQPISTNKNSWASLVLGNGGMASPVCPYCMSQMPEHQAILYRDSVTAENLPEFLHSSVIGIDNSEEGILDEITIVDELSEAKFDKIVQDFSPYTTDVDTKDFAFESGKVHATIRWDKLAVPNVVGENRNDVLYGLGYASGYTNYVEMYLFSTISATGSLFSIQAGGGLEFEITTVMEDLINKTFAGRGLNLDQVNGAKGVAKICDGRPETCEDTIHQFTAYVQGVNQSILDSNDTIRFLDTLGLSWPEWEVHNTLNLGAGMLGIFGDPGADEVASMKLLANLTDKFGEEEGQAKFADIMGYNATADTSIEGTTIDGTFPYPLFSDGSSEWDADRYVDPASIPLLDFPEEDVVEAKYREPLKFSNWLIVGPDKSSNGKPMIIGGPQMSIIEGLFMEASFKTTDNSFQGYGVTVPGLAGILMTGHAHDWAWALTSSFSDTADYFVEKLCNPDGGAVDEFSEYYEHNGKCIQMEVREGSANYTVHGPVTDYMTAEGEPVALTRQSLNFTDLGTTWLFFNDLYEGNLANAQELVDSSMNVSLALNLGFVSDDEYGMVVTGHRPMRAAGSSSILPTWGTGEWDWQGQIPEESIPKSINPANLDFMVNWNNQTAKLFRSGYNSKYNHWAVSLLNIFRESDNDVFTPYEVLDLFAESFTRQGEAILLNEKLSEIFTAEEIEELGLTEAAAELKRYVNDGRSLTHDLDQDGYIDYPGAEIARELTDAMNELFLESNNLVGISLGVFESSGLPAEGNGGSGNGNSTDTHIWDLVDKAFANGEQEVSYLGLKCGTGLWSSCKNLLTEAFKDGKENLIAKHSTEDPTKWLRKTSYAEPLLGSVIAPFTEENNPYWQMQNRPTFTSFVWFD